MQEKADEVERVNNVSEVEWVSSFLFHSNLELMYL